jgi:hypothetical protein
MSGRLGGLIGAEADLGSRNRTVLDGGSVTGSMGVDEPPGAVHGGTRLVDGWPEGERILPRFWGSRAGTTRRASAGAAGGPPWSRVKGLMKSPLSGVQRAKRLWSGPAAESPWPGDATGPEQPLAKMSRRRCAESPRTSCEPSYGDVLLCSEGRELPMPHTMN